MVELERELGHAPSEEQIAERMGISTEEYARIVSDVGRGAVTSLEDILVGSGGDGESLHVGDILPDKAAGPTDEVEMRERVRQLGLSIDRLPDRERLVIALYYYEGLTFKEIGKVLTVSESRVYQLHTQAVIRMRGYLGRDRDLFRES
jgi:RNA polymerase sigma factor for flagellar operon FliA